MRALVDDDAAAVALSDGSDGGLDVLEQAVLEVAPLGEEVAFLSLSPRDLVRGELAPLCLQLVDRALELRFLGN